MMEAETITAEYLTWRACHRDSCGATSGSARLRLKGATGNNLKGETLSIPLGTLTLVTGVSGSGKSSYINDTLYPALSKHFYRSLAEPLPHDEIEGTDI